MRILLINPSLRQATTGQYEKEAESLRGIYPPLGLAYIASALVKNKHSVKIIDCDVERGDAISVIENTVHYFEPDVVGFYAMTWTYRQDVSLAARVKKINPKIKTVIGGPNITCLPRESLASRHFDYGVFGEGEITIVELLEYLEGKKRRRLNKILGLIYKKGGRVYVNPPRPLINDLNSIPFPARNLLLMNRYYDVFSRRKHFATIFATRGCPFNCVFCDRRNRMGKAWRVRSPQNIADEIKEVIASHGIREFMFFDDNLIVNKEWGLKLCQELEKLNIIWECRNRVDLVDERLLRAMKKAGCYRIRFGFESGDNRILKILKKGITVEQSLKCAKMCKRVGMEIYGYFMIGSPSETPETIQKTIDLALKIDPSFAIFSKTILIPGSELFEFGVSRGFISRDYWARFLQGKETNGAPSLSTEELPESVVDHYVKMADNKFYFRPAFIISKLLSVKSFSHLISQARIGFALLSKK